MTRIKMIGLAILAVLAVAAVAAATASAAKNPVLVTSSGAAVNKVTVSSVSVTGTTPVLQEAGGGKIECETETGKATLSTTFEGDGMTSGPASATFTKCKSAAGNCSNTATSGEITGTISVLLVWVGKETNKTIGVLISILPFSGSPSSSNGLLSFKCGTAKILSDVQGSFVAGTNVKIGGAASTAAKLIAKQSGGKQEDETYTENGITGTNSLYTSTAGGAFERSAEEIESNETYSESVKVIEA